MTLRKIVHFSYISCRRTMLLFNDQNYDTLNQTTIFYDIWNLGKIQIFSIYLYALNRLPIHNILYLLKRSYKLCVGEISLIVKPPERAAAETRPDACPVKRREPHAKRKNSNISC